MKLKTKIQFALVLLFSAVFFLGLVGSHYLEKTTKNSMAITQNNQRTMDYTREMSNALNELIAILALDSTTVSYRRHESRKAFGHFERYLELQLNNLTEQREEDLTEQLREAWENFKAHFKSILYEPEFSLGVFMQRGHIQDLLDQVYELNEASIHQKENEADKLANKMTLYSIILSFFFFLFALFSMFYFPHYIADPVKRLTESIKQIAQKNYSQRLKVRSGDEFGEMARSFNKMAEKLEEFESINVHQIVSEKRRIETIIGRMNEAIIGLDNNQIILFVNPRALELMGMKEENVVGKKVLDLTRRNDLLYDIVKEVIIGDVNGNTTYSSVTIDKDGKRFYYNKDVLKVESQDFIENELANVGYVIILKNITELKEQDLAKTNFMATLSHELKTPISAIDMSLNLLEDKRLGGLNEDQKELSETIRENSERLLKMVNEILVISRIETGNIQIDYEEAHPETVVTKALENVKTFLSQKDLRVVQKIAENLPVFNMDIPKTTGVLVNFLTNAIRYSPPSGAIEIGVIQNNASVEFSVKDRGPGISKEDLKKVFRRYHRAKDDKTKGTGLGLAISKEFIEAQGGKIWVKSEIGEGSVFGFALPVSG